MLKKIIPFLAFALTLISCSAPQLPPKMLKPVSRNDDGQYQYRLAAQDIVSIFVWRNNELSGDYTIRPDGMLNMALTQPIMAEGLTTHELEKQLEKSLSELIKTPSVSVVVRQATGVKHEHVRIVGTGAEPYATIYTKGMSLLDLITQAGGLGPYAAGNRAKLIRTHHGQARTYSLRLDDLMEDGDLSANIDLQPGDVIKIPQAWF